MWLCYALLLRYKDRRTIAECQPRSISQGQRVWLCSKNLPLQTEARKLTPRFVGPFEVVQMVNPAAVHLKLPASLNIHPTLHVSRVKLVRESELSLRTPHRSTRSSGSWISADEAAAGSTS